MEQRNENKTELKMIKMSELSKVYFQNYWVKSGRI